MPNPGQPTIREGETGQGVRRAQRAIRRTPDPPLAVDGIFGPGPEAIRRHADAAELPVTEIIEVADTIIVRPDPIAVGT
jgi:hypothetical protein